MESDAERIERIQRSGREEQARLKALREAVEPDRSPEPSRVFLVRNRKPCHVGPAWLRRAKVNSIRRALAGSLTDSDRVKLTALLREVESHKDGGSKMAD